MFAPVTEALVEEGQIGSGQSVLDIATGPGEPALTMASSANQLSFQWQSRQAMTKEQIDAATKTFKSPVADPFYDVQDTVEVTLADSKVVEFEVHHVVTY